MERVGRMRIEHIQQYTEHHRYYVYRGFSLSPLDFKTISLIYQPMVGAVAASLYLMLYQHVGEAKAGYSGLDTQRRLFLGLGLEMNEAGRRQLVEAASRLEAVGLLQTSRLALPAGDDVVYEYELQQPLTPDEFFTNHHLALLLRDKIGKYAVIALREQFHAAEPDELAEAGLSKENITVPFYEIFRLNTYGVDEELEQALAEVAPARAPSPKLPPPSETAGLTYGDLILGFPRGSDNRAFVERLRTDAEGLAIVNYVAYKYDLDSADMRRLLDEQGVFSPAGELLLDELQRIAVSFYRQDRKREEDRQRAAARAGYSGGESTAADGDLPEELPVDKRLYLQVPAVLAGRCDIAQYNMLMRNEPHTRFLRRFFPGAVPAWLDRTFERIDLHYKMPREVINVFIHYVLGMNEAQRISGAFIDKVASNMLHKQVDTYEKAVQYVRDQQQLELKKKEAEQAPAGGDRTYRGGRGGSRSGASRKPAIPIVEKRAAGRQLSPEELEEALRMANELDGQA